MLRCEGRAQLHRLCGVFYFCTNKKIKILPYDYIKMWLCV